MKKSVSALRYISVICALSLIFLTFTSCAPQFKESSSFAMGSLITSKVYTDDEKTADEICEIINSSAAKVDKALSATDPESEISKLNKEKKIFPSEYLISVMKDTILLCNILERDVDISMGNVTALWGFATDSPAVPSDEDIKINLENRNIEKIAIDEALGKITIHDSISLDMGAFGKGAACDLIYENISSYKTPAIVSFGGTVMAYEKGPSDGKWKIAIRDPFADASSYFATLSLSTETSKHAVFVSTSGNYEKTFTQDGTAYHHILDPETGYPVENDLVSVTVISSSGLQADALSTACYIGGYNEETLKTLESFFAEAVFVFKDKTYAYTDGLEDSIIINNKDYKEKQQ